MANIPIIHKLQLLGMFQFADYNNNGIETYQKAHKHLPTKLLQRSKKV